MDNGVLSMSNFMGSSLSDFHKCNEQFEGLGAWG